MVVEIGFSVRAGMATNPGSNPACHACVDCAPELYKLVGSFFLVEVVMDSILCCLRYLFFSGTNLHTCKT